MKIEFKNKNITLEFEVDAENKIRLTYFGVNQNILLTPSTFVEADLTETNHSNNNYSKKCGSYFGANSKYLSHTISDNELVFVTSDEYLEIESHFVLYDDVAGLSTFNIVKNISKTPVNLEYISSFYLIGLGQKECRNHEHMFVNYALNGWNSEAQWRRQSFLDVALFNTNHRVNLNRFELNNTGSWSTKQYLPMCGIENELTKQFLLSQIENNGSWHIEIGDLNTKYYFAISGPEWSDNSFSKKLMPGDTFKSCQASTVLGSDFETSIQEITKLRRHLVKESDDHKEMPVIFNDFMHGTWDLSTEELIKPMVDAAKKAGVDTFVMDAGWFAEKTGWPNYIGEWKEYSANFPSGGLKGMFDYIHSLGMKAGLWFEIENIGIFANNIKDFDNHCFFNVNGKPVTIRNRHAFNFANPKVYKWATDVICDAIDRYGLDYIKLDYNMDAGVGNEINSSSLGDGLLIHNRKIIEFLREIQSKYPHLTIENCASGGQRLDYEMLKVCPIQSSSDLEDYRKYPHIAANLATACVPETGAIWSYPVCNDNEKIEITNEVVIMNMVNSLLGRLHLASKLYKLNDEQFELVKEGVELHKQLAEFKKNSLPVFPLGPSKFFDEQVAGGLVSGDKMLLCVWNTKGSSNEVVIDLSKYGANKVSVIYPAEVATNYEFNEKTGLLLVKFEENYMGRAFKVLLK